MNKKELAKFLHKAAEEVEAEKEEVEEKPEEEAEESEEEEEAEEEESTEEEEKPKEAEAKALATEIGKSFAEALKVSKEEPEEVKTQVAKILTPYGTAHVSYPTDLQSLSDEEKIVNFFKGIMFMHADPRSAEVVRALNEGTSAEGGYLVPAPLQAAVYRILPDIAIMRRLATVIPMTSKTLALNTLAARPYAYWTDEYAQKTTTSAEFGQKELTAYKLVCLLPITEQLVEDANINIVNFIIQLFAEAIATAEDKAFFTGSGTGQPRGISIETLGATVAAGGALTMDHIIALIDSVPQRVRSATSAAFVGHKYVKQLCRNLKDTSNNYIWRDSSVGRMSGQTEKLPDTLYGYPFYEQNDLPQSELYFGDWKYYAIGDRMSLEVTTTTEGGDAWRRDAVEVKAVIRVSGRMLIANAFAKITGI